MTMAGHGNNPAPIRGTILRVVRLMEQTSPRGKPMNTAAENTELVQMLTDARLSARLQLLEMLETKLDNLKASNANADQIITTLKAWASTRQSTVIKGK